MTSLFIHLQKLSLRRSNQSLRQNLILYLNLSLVLSHNQILGPGLVLLVLSLARSPVQSLVLSLILSLVLSQVLSQTLNRVLRKTIIGLRLGEILVEDRTLVEVRPPINRERDLTIPSKWCINMASWMMTWRLLKESLFFS